MLFSSLTFLLVFLPILIFLYFCFKNIKIRNIILLIFSLLFYAWGEPKYVLLMIASITVTYIAGLCIDVTKKKSALVLSIVLLLSSLVFFKYMDFLILNFNSIFKTHASYLNIVLPIGISFYTFQAISYLIDVYRGTVKVQKNFLNLALYVSLFPQLIAGPIVRYETICAEIENRKSSLDGIVTGLKRFIIGLSKKVILANGMALIADTIFDNNISGTFLIYVAALAYTFQIYYDFSGYSDMAIGLGKIFGFTFLENFDYPYISKSITEFWHRWHISLSTWFRDYVYIPLGGSRVKKIINIRNIFIVWMLTGLWHGASWNFIIWGIYYGVLLILEKFVLKNILDKIPSLLKYIVTMFLVIVGWVIFRVTDFSTLILTLRQMFIYTNSNVIDFIFNHADLVINYILFIPCVIFMFPYKKKDIPILSELIYIGLFIINIALLVGNTYNPFIYFRF